MPAATSSRRLRKQPTEDIEDAGSTQPRDEEEDVDEESIPSQPVARSKGGKKAKIPAIQEEEDAAEVDESDPLANFVDQPVDKGQAGRISGIAQDWDHMRKQVHKSSYALVRDIGSSFAEFMDGEKGEKNLENVDKLMRQLVDMENELHVHEQTLLELHQQVIRGEAVPEVIDRYEEGVKRRMCEYDEKTSRQKYAKHEEYASFRQAIYEVQNPDEAMPPVTDFIPKEDGDDSDEEDDVQVGGITQDYKCPITLRLLVDPLTSDICHHSYEASVIREVLKNSHTAREKCPMAGCNKVISLANLKPNKELAKKAKEAARRERMREEDSDADSEEVL